MADPTTSAACEWCGRAVKRNDEGRWYAVKGEERGYDPLACEASDDCRHSPDQPTTTAAPTLAERLLDVVDPDRAARRINLVLDLLEAAFDRHRSIHPKRQRDCEMCDLRGALAAHEMTGWPNA